MLNYQRVLCIINWVYTPTECEWGDLPVSSNVAKWCPPLINGALVGKSSNMSGDDSPCSMVFWVHVWCWFEKRLCFYVYWRVSVDSWIPVKPETGYVNTILQAWYGYVRYVQTRKKKPEVYQNPLIYPLVINDSNGKSLINGGFNRKFVRIYIYMYIYNLSVVDVQLPCLIQRRVPIFGFRSFYSSELRLSSRTFRVESGLKETLPCHQTCLVVHHTNPK